MRIRDKLKLIDSMAATNKAKEEEWKKSMKSDKSKLTGVLLDTVKNTISEVTIPNTLEGLYKALRCEYIEIVTRRVGRPETPYRRRYAVICDEEGRMKDNAVISGLTPGLNEPAFVGSVLIVSAENDGDGELKSLTPEEIAEVKANGFITLFGRNIMVCDW